MKRLMMLLDDLGWTEDDAMNLILAFVTWSKVEPVKEAIGQEWFKYEWPEESEECTQIEMEV